MHGQTPQQFDVDYTKTFILSFMIMKEIILKKTQINAWLQTWSQWATKLTWETFSCSTQVWTIYDVTSTLDKTQQNWGWSFISEKYESSLPKDILSLVEIRFNLSFKKAWLFIWTKLNPPTLWCFGCYLLSGSWEVGSQKSSMCPMFLKQQRRRRRTRFDQKSSL